MSIFEKGKKTLHIPTVAREVYDITGAGDTVIATAALALLSGSSILEAAVLANAAAGIVVGKIGTAAVTSEELLESLKP
jgi:D-beta-D-heptose 7-phosphate kinase/D-beta-D-heptose 1-phosphate adenosyltransferase